MIDILNKIAMSNPVIAQPIIGEWLTTGDPLRFIQATIKFGLERDDLKDELRSFMKSLI